MKPASINPTTIQTTDVDPMVFDSAMFDKEQRLQLLTWSQQAHATVEAAYRAHPATSGDASWPQKQRLLLADMALHLLQTALHEGDLSSAHLRRNLYAILTIADPMLPACQLKATADGLYATQDDA